MSEYVYNYKVKLDDLDYMGIVGHSHWLIFLERARIDLLEEIGFPFSEMQKQKIGGVVAEIYAKYTKPAFFDDQVKVKIKPHNLFNKGFKLEYIVLDQNDNVYLNADITMIFVDSHGKSTQVPNDLKNKLFNY